MKNKVCVLLSTYNGVSFLQEQLDSILNQTCQLDLYIRDDGSTDATMQLLEKLPNTKDGKNIIILNRGQHESDSGYPLCFFRILKQCKNYEFYFWCDQDDVWMPHKLESMVALLDAENSNIPLMGFHRFYYCDESLNVITKSSVVNQPITLENSLFDLKEAFGFSVVFNHMLKKKLLSAQRDIIKNGRRDWWGLLIASSFGKVIYCREVLAYYRRHSAAVTYKGTKHGISKMRNRITKFSNKGKAMQCLYEGIHSFLNLYQESMSKEQCYIVGLFSQKGKRLQKVFCRYRIRNKIHEEIIFRVLFLIYG